MRESRLGDPLPEMTQEGPSLLGDIHPKMAAPTRPSRFRRLAATLLLAMPLCGIAAPAEPIPLPELKRLLRLDHAAFKAAVAKYGYRQAPAREIYERDNFHISCIYRSGSEAPFICKGSPIAAKPAQAPHLHHRPFVELTWHDSDYPIAYYWELIRAESCVRRSQRPILSGTEYDCETDGLLIQVQVDEYGEGRMGYAVSVSEK